MGTKSHLRYGLMHGRQYTFCTYTSHCSGQGRPHRGLAQIAQGIPVGREGFRRVDLHAGPLTHLSHIIEVSVGVTLQLFELGHFI